MQKVIKAWSFSSWKLWDTCRFAWKKRWIDGIKDSGFNPAFARGTEIHAKAEYLVKGEIKGMPNELKIFSNEFRNLMAAGAEAETDLSITEAMKPSFGTDWDNVWCRIKVDAKVFDGHTSTLIDYKTGKKYGDNQEQCGLYAVGEYVHNPKLKQVDTELWYLDLEEDNVELHTYTVADIKKLIKMWKKRVAPMFERQDEYPPNPCHKCRFCSHASDKGGDCPYNSKGTRA